MKVVSKGAPASSVGRDGLFATQDAGMHFSRVMGLEPVKIDVSNLTNFNVLSHIFSPMHGALAMAFNMLMSSDATAQAMAPIPFLGSRFQALPRSQHASEFGLYIKNMFMNEWILIIYNMCV